MPMATLANRFGIGLNKEAPKWLLLLLIAVITLAVYWPVLGNNFITYDDPDYVTGNLMVRRGLTGEGFAWAFSAFHAGNWHPITWLSHMLDVELFGINPEGHHAVGLLFHTANALLLCTLLSRLTGFRGRSAIVALLFALHPLHVESAAWIAERKDVLSTFFWLLTMMAYFRYTQKPSLLHYLPVLLFFAMGLMAKQMLVTLPVILLLMDWWPLDRFHNRHTGPEGSRLGSMLAEKVPLLLMAAGAAVITIRAQSSAGAIARSDHHSLLIASGNALLSYVNYIRKMFWPTDLALFYPFEPSAVTVLPVLASLLLLSLLSAFALMQAKKRPWLTFGWFWYLITLLPAIGFIRIGSQAMADRYTYIPLIGLFLAAVWEAAVAVSKLKSGKLVAAGLTAAVLGTLAWLTFIQVSLWQDSFTLYRHALDVVERNWLAHNNLGILLSQHHRNDEAVVHFRETVRLNPSGGAGFRNLGNSLQMAGKNNEAIHAFREAVRLDPDDADGHFRLGYAYLSTGNRELAMTEYHYLQRLDPLRAAALFDSLATGRPQ